MKKILVIIFWIAWFIAMLKVSQLENKIWLGAMAGAWITATIIGVVIVIKQSEK